MIMKNISVVKRTLIWSRRALFLLLFFFPLMAFSGTVVDVVINSPEHTTLETAVVSAGLTDDLSAAGPFTLFAPTDAAFAALPASILDPLLADPTGELARVLLYHVAGFKALAADLNNGQQIATLYGKNLEVTLTGGKMYVNNARITVSDIQTDNGVVHVIDAVLIPPCTTVMDIIANSPVLTILESALFASGVNKPLQTPGPYTVFAPTDAAFAALPEGVLESLLLEPEGELAKILLYHVAGVNALSGDLINDQMIESYNGKKLHVTISEGKVHINNALVTMADIKAGNGIVHVVDAVLLPPTNTVVDVIINSPNHTTLENAVVAAGLADDLSVPGTFTVFAPTDAAFAALPTGALDALLEDPTGTLAKVLLYHVVGVQAFSTDLTNDQQIATLNGKNITVSITDGNVFINNAKVTIADIEADNGVVHVVDAVLMPPPNTVVDVIVNSPDHNTLESAVVAAGLVDELSAAGPFTVFAPTDAAFAALPEGVLEALLEDPEGELAQTLLFHVSSGISKTSELCNDELILMLNGKRVKIIRSEGKLYVNGAMISVANIMADNGIVHVLDAVILPQTITVMDIIAASPNHLILEMALKASNLNETISASGPFTIFAPTDEAFVALPEAVIYKLMSTSEDTLKNILLYHVVGAEALSSTLFDGQKIMTLSGDKVEIALTDDEVFINTAKVSVADLIADNGVVHVIDAVLLPSDFTIPGIDIPAVQISVTPNPASEFISIQVQNNKTLGGKLSIYNSSGRKISEQMMKENLKTIDVSNLQPGLYMVIYQGQNETVTQKVILR